MRKVHDSGSFLDSGAWVQVTGDLEFTPKIFNDPKNTSSDKENSPINNSQTMLMLNDLNITDGTVPEGLPKRPPNFVVPYCLTCMPNGLGAFAYLNWTGKTLQPNKCPELAHLF